MGGTGSRRTLKNKIKEDQVRISSLNKRQDLRELGSKTLSFQLVVRYVEVVWGFRYWHYVIIE